MKTRFLLFLGVMSFFFGFSQNPDFDLFKNKTQTHILYDRVFGVSNATHLKTQEVSSAYFFQVYSEMQRADFNNRLPALKFLKDESNNGFSQNQIPLSILLADFESIKPSAIESGDVYKDANGKYDSRTNKVLEMHHINLMASLLSKTKSNNPVFVLKKDLVFNTTNRELKSIEIQQHGKWIPVAVDIPFQLKFDKNGIQNVEYRMQLNNGETLQQSFSILVDYQQRSSSSKVSEMLSPQVVHNITSSIAYQGYGDSQAYQGIGEYEVFLDSVDGILDKPIILLDGFDPGDSRNTSAIYNLLNYGSPAQNLGDLVRAQGYDVIVLNFPEYTRPGTSTVIDGGVDYIQRNAMILVELLNLVNSQKVGGNKNVVIGPSMGGLISRYALRYMEQNGLNHDARLYISFDSPHLGANVPIGFQHLFNYMGYGPIGDTSMQSLVDGMLKSPAAREMLIDHFEGHLQSGSAFEFDSSKLLPVGSPNYRTVFQNELNTMGFPQNTRNVAIVNGAGNATTNGTPGMEVMNHTFNTSSTQRAIININYTPSANQTKEVSHFKGQQWILFWVTFYESAASSKSPSYTDGLDTSPGGRFDLSAFASNTSGSAMMTEFLQNLKTNYFSFIPAISAMSITSTNNLYAPIGAGLNTPFAAFSAPSTNENHVTLQNQNVQFALNEILQSELSTSETLKSQVSIENPVGRTLKISSKKLLKNVSVKIMDASGKLIDYRNNLQIQGIMELPVSLPKGNYILNLSAENQNLSFKLIKD